jgi:flagellar basal-body rod modification protein FlgD
MKKYEPGEMAMSTGAVSPTQSSSSKSTTANSGLNALQPSDFMNMLMTELQNQDPLSPMDTGQMLQEITQISNIESNNQLTSTLQGVLLGQNLAAASSLLQRNVQGLDAAGNSVSGQVQSVTVSNGTATLNIGNDSLPLSNVTEILPGGSTS